ncbi:hypothetical protein ACHAXH_006232, partial [Discostella pseudostelligera]
MASSHLRFASESFGEVRDLFKVAFASTDFGFRCKLCNYERSRKNDEWFWKSVSMAQYDCLPLDSDHLPFVNCQFVDSAGVLRGSLLLVGASVSSSTWNCWGTMEVYGEWRERDILSEVFLLSINQDIHQLGGEYTQVSRSNAELRSTLSY